VPRLPFDYVAARGRLDAAHRAAPRTFPTCERCGLALTLGQQRLHLACREAMAVDAAEADHELWEAEGAPEPEPPAGLLFPLPQRVHPSREVTTVRATGGRL
jgi:hypothetical protein